MWLIAGLGNPGPEYEKTRHNLGFLVLDALSGRWKIPIVQAERNLETGKGRRRGETILLARPLAYMNRSGEVIAPLARREGVPAEKILVLVDDLDLPLGTVRYRPRGSTAGHRGMESMVECLGADQFPRIRLGIGRPEERDKAESEYVLTPFTEAELPVVEKAVERAVGLAEKVVFEGITDPATVRITELKEGT
ncbi:MAG: aminoacyl-tRNA hydrolase [bacterium]|nr:aminoacyl-tRNA hydrolase [bacterium]MDT8395943.1 aminoacyl-tRNA hydrolase [bacterium]